MNTVSIWNILAANARVRIGALSHRWRPLPGEAGLPANGLTGRLGPGRRGASPAATGDQAGGPMAGDGSPTPRLAGRRGRARLDFLAPSFADWVFISILAWLFFGSAAATSLLGDGDTGWHIRAGEYILETGEFPRHDLFSFTMEGREWFAWEWLADVLFAVLHSVFGLKGISFLGGVVIAGTAAGIFRYMLWRGVNVLVAMVSLFVILSPSMLHWLARPHMFTWVFLLITLWVLEADRRKPTRWLYALVPLTVLWTNTHGGFVAQLITIGIYFVGTGVEEVWNRPAKQTGDGRWQLPPSFRRYGLLLLLCSGATLINPYGYQLHVHIAAYLRSDFILKAVQEFQAPDFRGEAMKVFECVLFLAILLAAKLLARREVARALLLLAWAHAAVTSVRHIPLFMMVAGPLLASEATRWLEAAGKRGNQWVRVLNEIAADYSPRGGGRFESRPLAVGWLSLAAMAALMALLQLLDGKPSWTAEFPPVRFPAMACDSLGERLKGRRVLSTDQWGDYLIYRFYPEQKVFIDGRSDFYDREVLDDYMVLLGATWRWEEVLSRYEFEAVLIPVDWSLSAVLKTHPEWHLAYDDGTAVFFERVPPSRGKEGS